MARRGGSATACSPARHHHDLLRSADRGRHRKLDAAEHAGRLHRIAGLADIRDAGHSGDRRGRARHGALVLMDNTWATPAPPPGVRAWRRLVDPGRHQIYRRPLRHLLGTVSANADDAAAAEGDGLQDGTLRRPRRHVSRRCAACARLPCGCAPSGVGIDDCAVARTAPGGAQRPASRLPSDPGHAIWKRDFTGACGLFGMVLQARAGEGRVCLPRRARRCSASAPRGAASKASPSRSMRPATAPPRPGRRAARWCASMSASRTSRI